VSGGWDWGVEEEGDSTSPCGLVHAVAYIYLCHAVQNIDILIAVDIERIAVAVYIDV